MTQSAYTRSGPLCSRWVTENHVTILALKALDEAERELEELRSSHDKSTDARNQVIAELRAKLAEAEAHLKIAESFIPTELWDHYDDKFREKP